MGKLIAIDGLDGSGKHTQCQMLLETLQEQGRNVKLLSFPKYDSESSSLVKMYLRGDFGTNPNDVNPYAASSFYAVDRYADYKMNWKEFYEEEDSVIIADRYTTANAVHQLAKLNHNYWEQQTGRKTDIHEKDPNYINNCYNAAKYTADNYGWKRITCFSGKEPLSPERIHAEVEKAVTYLLDVNG